MRAVLGMVTLLLALAVVGVLATRQITGGARLVAVPASAEGASGVSPHATPSPTPEAARQIQQQVRDDLRRAMEQAARRDEIDP